MLSTWDNRRRTKQQKKDHIFGFHTTLLSSLSSPAPSYLSSSVLTSCNYLSLHNCYVTLISKQSVWWEGFWLPLTWSRIEATQNSTQSALDSLRPVIIISPLLFIGPLPLAPLLRIMWQSSPVTMVTGPFLGNVIADLLFSAVISPFPPTFSLYLLPSFSLFASHGSC